MNENLGVMSIGFLLSIIENNGKIWIFTQKKKFFFLIENFIKKYFLFYFIKGNQDDAIIWRGPRKNGLIK